MLLEDDRELVLPPGNEDELLLLLSGELEEDGVDVGADVFVMIHGAYDTPVLAWTIVTSTVTPVVHTLSTHP